MGYKISKAAKDLNVGVQTIKDFLQKKGVEVSDNPNSRLSEDVFAMLVKQFKPDMEQKRKIDGMISERQKVKAKAASQKPEEALTPSDIKLKQNKPKVLGTIDQVLGRNKPIAPVAPELVKPKKPAAPETMAEQKPTISQHEQEKPLEVSAPATPKPVDAAEQAQDKTAAEAAPVPDAPQKNVETEARSESAPEESEPVKSESQRSVTDTDGAKPSESEPKKGPEIFEFSTAVFKKPTVVGTIDLSSIDQSTRPKKKNKGEHRADRAGKVAADGQRHKRRRIDGKVKVDIEKSAQQIQHNPAPTGGGRNINKRNKKKDTKRPLRPEVNAEDVQRQMKETLARLTSKKEKKSAKWRREKREAVRQEERQEAQERAAEKKVLKLTEFVTVNDLASMMNVPVNKVIGTCMGLGLMVSINQRLDAEAINLLAEEFGFKTEYESADVAEAIQEEEDRPEDLEQRPPVVTVMGHVDHGKTSLLDYIRKSNVIAGEAGGITQHIGAYNVKLPNGRRITFLDTPGHEAFTAMRARGAKVTDVVIVIVAADDAVMPQTEEALSHSSAAGVPIVFAINKIDKPGANPDKIKEELASRNYLVEEWGGKYQSQDISAKKGTGVNELMEKVLLEADMLDLKANPNRRATGSVIESSLDKGRGYVATVLVDNGTLHMGDIVLAGTHFGKVKAMFNERNQRITEAGPSCPALILGLNGAPTAGDKFNVMETEQEARQIANKREQLQRELGLRTQKRLTLEDIGRRRALGDFHELNVIVKGDVDGSIEALSDSLLKLSTPEIKVNVVLKAVGAITESDVTLAAASDAYIIGFQVRPNVEAKRLAQQEGVDIRIYSIIYDAIEEVKDAMAGLLSPEIKEQVLGSVVVKQVYHISKVGTIAGAQVTEGKIKAKCKVRVIRDGIVRHTGVLASLKRYKDDAKEVLTGFECGLSVQNFNDLQEGDIIEPFEEVEVQKTL